MNYDNPSDVGRIVDYDWPTRERSLEVMDETLSTWIEKNTWKILEMLSIWMA
jgi:hypothetical protein